MHRIVQLICLVVTALSLLTTSGAAPASDQITVASVLDRMSKSFSGMRSMRASLSQEKRYTQLGVSDPVEQGTLFVKKRNDRDIRLRLEINFPEKRIITVKGNRYQLFQPAINQVIEGAVDKHSATAKAAGGFFSYLFGGVSKAAEDYHITAVGEETIGRRRAIHLKLTPLAGRKSLYRQVDLWVDPELWLPTQQQFIEVNRDETVIQLFDIKTNVPVDDGLFNQKVPPNAHRVRG
ncbi:MAG: outer membrane lipoprotein carrier protein LolA [Acidobacteria bacterium]|nr:outer membrane lipoprotein carrier protein LolA [Acidobacteriota bacterium]